MCFLFFLGTGNFFCVVRAVSVAPSAVKTAVCFLLSNFSYLLRWAVRLPSIFLALAPPSATLPSPRFFLRCLLLLFGLAGVALAREGWISGARDFFGVTAAAALLSRRLRGGLAHHSFLHCLPLQS